MKKFTPRRVLIEEQALDYPLGQQLEKKFTAKETPIRYIDSHNRVQAEEEMEPTELFNWTKETLVVGVKKTLNFKSCQPSADYRLVTSTSCPGKCEYCYLAKSLGSASYIRVYVNLEEIIAAIKKHIKKEAGEVVTFEASSSSDPVAVEHLTGSLAQLIDFFADQPQGRLRVVTKFAFVDNLLTLDHESQTRFRFSINTSHVVDNFEHATSSLRARMKAAGKIQQAGYPTGFIIAPLIIHQNWRQGYKKMLAKLKQKLPKPESPVLSFELIMYRFSTQAKNLIETRFPNTKLDLNKEDYHHKGFGKYVYPKEKAKQLKEFIIEQINNYFPQAEVEYFT